MIQCLLFESRRNKSYIVIVLLMGKERMWHCIIAMKQYLTCVRFVAKTA